MFDVSSLKFNGSGLITAVTQDYRNKDVLMVAFMNEEAVRKTLETGKVHYFSRSRGALWLKGETSGHFQHVKEIRYDCDADALLIFIDQTGVACHTGERSCFFRTAHKVGNAAHSAPEIGEMLRLVNDKIADRRDNPVDGSYTNKLFDKGLDVMLKKVGEESSEIIIAAKNQNNAELTWEAADFLYHLNVVLVKNGVTWSDVAGELNRRYHT